MTNAVKWRGVKTLRAAARATTLERHVEAAVCDRLRLNGWKVHRLKSDVQPGNRRQKQEQEEVGTPDYIAIFTEMTLNRAQKNIFGTGPYDYRLWALCDVIYIEAKRPGGKLRTSQTIWHAEARKAGYIVIVADSIEQFEQEYVRYFGSLR